MAKLGKGGRVPASEKQVEDAFDEGMDDLDFNQLQLDEDLRKEFKEKGIVPRWINATKYLQGGNFHKSGWRAYRRKVTDEERGNVDFNLGVSPEGYIIRNDLILAFKKTEDHKRWGSRIKKLTDAQSGKDSDRAARMREAAREAGVGVKIHDGYDANGDLEADDE